jgi:HemY protein
LFQITLSGHAGKGFVMVRLVIYLLSVLLIASGLGWLADRPGTLQIAWQGYDIETSVFRAVVLLAAAIAMAIFLWSVVRAIWNSPAALGDRIVRRRNKRGLEALSSGMIAVGAGDKLLATRYALQARKTLPHEPLTHLLRAQAAQLSGDRTTTRRIYEAMLASPETEQLGLRGLFLEAEREGETEAAAQFAGRALKTNAKLGWAPEALFETQCKQKDWAAALETLSHAKRNGHLDKAGIDRKRAVLLTAQAQDAEENETDKALTLALEAHNLAPDLVPAAAVAGRILASRGNTGKAAKDLGQVSASRHCRRLRLRPHRRQHA